MKIIIRTVLCCVVYMTVVHTDIHTHTHTHMHTHTHTHACDVYSSCCRLFSSVLHCKNVCSVFQQSAV